MCELVSLEANWNILDMSLAIYNHDGRDLPNPEDYLITDGDQILAPKFNLWEEEEE